ncbi:hypothetical protein EDD16DRAFT_932435 [Pisolithus croceorrhizus]|nr:hypothetical protein EDD16DRAFT_932435 [Pisolithus croceorrhizus]
MSPTPENSSSSPFFCFLFCFVLFLSRFSHTAREGTCKRGYSVTLYHCPQRKASILHSTLLVIVNSERCERPKSQKKSSKLAQSSGHSLPYGTACNKILSTISLNAYSTPIGRADRGKRHVVLTFCLRYNERYSLLLRDFQTCSQLTSFQAHTNARRDLRILR